MRSATDSHLGRPNPRRRPIPGRGSALVVAIVVASALAAGCSLPVDTPSGPDEPAGPAKPKPPRADPLTGTRLSPGDGQPGVFAVKIDNTAAARPQIGLDSADLVIVEEVEGGITRLIGVYHSDLPTKVGPVRSARNTDVQLLPMFGKPGLVYSGANSSVQAQIDAASLVAIERSDRDATRGAPHNVMVDLQAVAQDHKVGKAADIGLQFAKSANGASGDDPAAKVETVQATVGNDAFAFGFGAQGYAPTWNGSGYGSAAAPVRADNVIVLHVRNRRDTDSTSKISIVSETVGKGQAEVYRDGRKLAGSWSRRNAQGKLDLNSAGRPMRLKPGKTWILLQGS